MAGDTTNINSNALNHLVLNAAQRGFPLSNLDQTDSDVQQSPDVSIPEADTDYQRDFLAAISGDEWNTIITWAAHRNLLTQNSLGYIAKIDKGIRLTNAQTEQLWKLRDKIVAEGFPENQFAPRPTTSESK